MCINDLAQNVLDISSPLFFGDDTSFVVDQEETKFKFLANEAFNETNKSCYSNLLMLNCDKTYFIQFATKTDQETIMQVSSGDRTIAPARSLKFWGLTVDTSLTWKHHVPELTSRLNKACCAIRSIKLFMFMFIDVLRSTYFWYVH
jgi:hypothetical protein